MYSSEPRYIFEYVVGKMHRAMMNEPTLLDIHRDVMSCKILLMLDMASRICFAATCCLTRRMYRVDKATIDLYLRQRLPSYIKLDNDLRPYVIETPTCQLAVFACEASPKQIMWIIYAEAPDVIHRNQHFDWTRFSKIAAWSGNLELVRWSVVRNSCGPRAVMPDLFEWAIASRNIKLIRWLRCRSMPDQSTAVTRNLMRYRFYARCVGNDEAYWYFNDEEILMSASGFSVSDEYNHRREYVMAALGGDIGYLTAQRNTDRWVPRELTIAASAGGHTHVLEWIEQYEPFNALIWSKYIEHFAVMFNRENVLEWLRTRTAEPDVQH
jgi:hypothetical protein